jgi:hypothetical protein
MLFTPPCSRSGALLLAGVLLLGPRLAPAAPRIHLRTSRTHGLHRFVESLGRGGGWRRSEVLRRIFEGSRHDTPRARALIAEYARLRAAHFTRGYSFDGRPAGRGEAGFDVARFFDLQSARARDLRDWAGRTSQLVPPSAHRRLFAIYAALAPAYDELIWRPSRRKLERYRRRLRRVARRARLGEMFERARTFYGGRWPDDLPLTVVLHPVPAARGRTTATIIADVAPVEALLDEEDLAGRFGVVFHEICHGLYAAQPPRLQRELDRHFTTHRSPYAAQAYTLINEALATALGNGWATYRASGRLDPGSWYNDPQIAGFARALYPEVRAYLAARRTIDREFVLRAVEKLRRAQPEAIRAYANLLKDLFLATDGKAVDLGEARRVVRRHFRVPSMIRASPLGGAGAAAALRRTRRRAAVLLVFSPGEEGQLRRLARAAPAAPALGPWLDRLVARRGSWVFSALDARHRPWIVLRLARPAQLGRALTALKERRVIDPRRPFISLSP